MLDCTTHDLALTAGWDSHITVWNMFPGLDLRICTMGTGPAPQLRTAGYDLDYLSVDDLSI